MVCSDAHASCLTSLRTVSYHLGEKKWFYFHPSDPETHWWCMPDEVRYYLPPADYDRVSQINLLFLPYLSHCGLGSWAIQLWNGGKI